MSRWPRLTSVTFPWLRWTRVRNPSHFGSYSHCAPSGIWPGGRGAASIGSMSSGMGSVTARQNKVMLRTRPVALMRLEGTIGVGIRSADWVPVLDGIRRSLRIKAVALEVDSRGGSASASDYIHEALRRVAAEKPVVAFTGNLCASGGYLIAAAARRFIVQPAALVGSIGVISVRPQAYELMQRIGVAVRVAKSDRL